MLFGGRQHVFQWRAVAVFALRDHHMRLQELALSGANAWLRFVRRAPEANGYVLRTESSVSGRASVMIFLWHASPQCVAFDGDQVPVAATWRYAWHLVRTLHLLRSLASPSRPIAIAGMSRSPAPIRNCFKAHSELFITKYRG